MTEIDSDKSLTRITGKSALYSLGIALIGVFILSLLYGLISTGVNTFESGQFDVWKFLGSIVGFFQVLGLCVGPVIFLLSFALLQRLRLPW